jgi:hypothetical protein
MGLVTRGRRIGSNADILGRDSSSRVLALRPAALVREPPADRAVEDRAWRRKLKVKSCRVNYGGDEKTLLGRFKALSAMAGRDGFEPSTKELKVVYIRLVRSIR